MIIHKHTYILVELTRDKASRLCNDSSSGRDQYINIYTGPAILVFRGCLIALPYI